jgi:hypothetical protein
MRPRVCVASRGFGWLDRVSAAPRPRSGDLADHDFPMIAASRAGRVCVVWVDDRRGALDVWTYRTGAVWFNSIDLADALRR